MALIALRSLGDKTQGADREVLRLSPVGARAENFNKGTLVSA